MHVKGVFSTIHPASERMRFMVRVLPKRLNRRISNTFSVHLLKNTIANENQCCLIGINAIVTITTDL